MLPMDQISQGAKRALRTRTSLRPEESEAGKREKASEERTDSEAGKKERDMSGQNTKEARREECESISGTRGQQGKRNAERY